MAGYRKPYSKKEETKMLQYIIDNQAYTLLRGRAFWEGMEESRITERSWQSLKEHFRKVIVPKLRSNYYNDIILPERMRIYSGFNSTAREPKPKEKEEDNTWMYLTSDSDTE